MASTPIIALDYPSADRALALVDELGPLCRFYKIGSELFGAAGPSVVSAVRGRGCDVFLDLKLHDIPNTVSGAVKSAVSAGARLVTVHATGGDAMLRAAADAAAASSCEILAVTVLTSLTRGEVAAAWGRNDSIDLRSEVLRLAAVAAEAGVHGVVCSGLEAAAVRDRFGSRLTVLVPGVRRAGGATQDQSRVVTPREAAAAGARYIVVGRAVTGSADPCQAMREIIADVG